MRQPERIPELDSEGDEDDSYESPRPSLDETMMIVAHVLSQRSTCVRGQVGCVIVDANGFIMSTGYNGAPRGMRHCTDVGCLMEGGHCVRSAHAEQNAIITAGRYGADISGSTIYTTTRPCLRCILMMIQAGIEEIVYEQSYVTDDEQTAWEVVREARMKMRRLR